MSLRHGTVCLLISLALTTFACHPRPAAEPTLVARGLRFVSHNVAFDAFFADLRATQMDMASLPDQERGYRKELAKELNVEQSATVNVLAERAATLAQAISSKGTSLKLDIEGLEAVDEADTSAQMRVSGSLETDQLRFAEAVTRTARAELKLLAHLNFRGQSLQRLTARAAVLDGELDQAFAGKDSQLIEQVRRNLSDAKLLISMMEERRVDLAAEARRTVERLANAVTTNASLGAPNEPPLVTFVRPPPEPSKEKVAPRKAGGGPASRGGTPKSPSEAPSAPATADFEP
jgi:hypothetical protein